MKTLVGLLAVGAAMAPAAAPIPLPEAPVRVYVEDPSALDAVMTGPMGSALRGSVDEDDPLVKAWRWTQVGAKLEAQWAQFTTDVHLTWREVMLLRPTAVGIALLDAGNLEVLLVVRSPLAELPFPAPEGREQVHAGAPYTLVRRGAADGGEDPDRRMGLALARHEGHFLFATSDRALRKGLESLGAAPPDVLPGLASMDLDMDALREDLYFRREYLFPVEETGHIQAALTLEDGVLVERRRGAGAPKAAASRLHVAGALASGWETRPDTLLAALRGSLLEPVPVLSERPRRAVAPLPPVRDATIDPYLVNFEKHAGGGGVAWEEADLQGWRELMAKVPVAGWGYVVLPGGKSAICFPWPDAAQRDLEMQCRATVERRTGSTTLRVDGGTTRFLVGPGLTTLAIRRAGSHVWVGPDVESLKGLGEPQAEPGLVRVAHLRLDAIRAEEDRVARAEEAASGSGELGPIAGRIFALRSWMPGVASITVERHAEKDGWSEVVRFQPPED